MIQPFQRWFSCKAGVCWAFTGGQQPDQWRSWSDRPEWTPGADLWRSETTTKSII